MSMAAIVIGVWACMNEISISNHFENMQTLPNHLQAWAAAADILTLKGSAERYMEVWLPLLNKISELTVTQK